LLRFDHPLRHRHSALMLYLNLAMQLLHHLVLHGRYLRAALFL
jgi:hypothetical protein